MNIDVDYVQRVNYGPTPTERETGQSEHIPTLTRLRKIFEDDLIKLSSNDILDPTESEATLKEQLAGLKWAKEHVSELHQTVEAAITKLKEDTHV